MSRDYANGRNCFVAGVNPKKAGEDFEGIPIYGTVADAKKETGATVSVIYVPPPFAAAAIDEAVDAGIELVICITEGIPVRDMIRTRARMKGTNEALGKKMLAESGLPIISADTMAEAAEKVVAAVKA